MHRKRFSLLLSLLFFAQWAGAENPKFTESQEITDAVLKANAGSLSRYSLRFNFSYSGPPIGDLSARDQPNPDQTVTVTATSLTGSFGGRYRLSSNSSLSLTLGLSDRYIFHEDDHFDVNNPYLGYDYAFRWRGIQMLSSPGVSIITAERLLAIGEVAGLTYVLSSIYDLPASHMALGLDASFGYYLFSRPWSSADGKVRRMVVGANPSLKYNATDKLNFYTGLIWSLYNPRANGSVLELYARTTSAKFGVGYAFSREVYVTPYVGFYPGQFAWDTTTLNIATVFSIL